VLPQRAVLTSLYVKYSDSVARVKEKPGFFTGPAGAPATTGPAQGRSGCTWEGLLMPANREVRGLVAIAQR